MKINFKKFLRRQKASAGARVSRLYIWPKDFKFEMIDGGGVRVTLNTKSNNHYKIQFMQKLIQALDVEEFDSYYARTGRRARPYWEFREMEIDVYSESILSSMYDGEDEIGDDILKQENKLNQQKVKSMLDKLIPRICTWINDDILDKEGFREDDDIPF